MVWDGDYPWDVRVEKICKTLVENGHETHLVCRNSRALPRREVLDGIHIRRTFSLARKGLLNTLITFPFFFSPVWRREIRQAIKEIKPDVVIIRDLPIALAVTPFTHRAKIPTVLDMAESYPEMIRAAWKFEPFRLSNVFVRNPYLADWVEKATLRKLDMAWVVIEESAARLQRKGLSQDKIRVVRNTPPLDTNPLPSATTAAAGQALRIVYLGLINPSRGLATVVEAAQLLKQRGIAFKVHLIGTGKDFSRIKNMVDTLKLQDEVKLTGWIDIELVKKILSESNVGLVPHYRCSHWDHTFSNKIYDYMVVGIPVVVSDPVPVKRVVLETQAGLSYSGFSATELADCLTRLTDPTLRATLGANGIAAVQTSYNWAVDSKTLLESLDYLQHRGA
jgi:glycosyltransferase involved in cell wall biosynthesis